MHIGSSAQTEVAPSEVTRSDLSFSPSSSLQVGKYSVQITWGQNNIPFEFEVLAPPRIAVTEMEPTQGSARGSEEIVFAVKNLPAKLGSSGWRRKSELIVTFEDSVSSKKGQVTRVIWSTSRDTRFVVITPALAAGGANVTIYLEKYPSSAATHFFGSSAAAGGPVTFTVIPAAAPDIEALRPSKGFGSAQNTVSIKVRNWPSTVPLDSPRDCNARLGDSPVVVDRYLCYSEHPSQ